MEREWTTEERWEVADLFDSILPEYGYLPWHDVPDEVRAEVAAETERRWKKTHGEE